MPCGLWCAPRPREAEASNLPGWRQSQYRLRKVKQAFNRVRRMRQAQTRPAQVKAYLGELSGPGDQSSHDAGGVVPTRWGRGRMCNGYKALSITPSVQIDQISRRLLHGEAIPHGEKVFSIF